MTRVAIQATKLRKRTAVTTAKVPKNHLMSGRNRGGSTGGSQSKGTLVAPAPLPSSPSLRPVVADALHQPVDHGGGKVELGHVVAAVADGLADLVVADLLLPVRAGEVGRPQHRPLGAVAPPLGAVVLRAALHPGQLGEGCGVLLGLGARRARGL